MSLLRMFAAPDPRPAAQTMVLGRLAPGAEILHMDDEQRDQDQGDDCDEYEHAESQRSHRPRRPPIGLHRSEYPWCQVRLRAFVPTYTDRVTNVVPPKPTCRKCGAVVKPGRRCP